MGCYGNEGSYEDNGGLITEQRKVLIVCLTALLPLIVEVSRMIFCIAFIIIFLKSRRPTSNRQI